MLLMPRALTSPVDVCLLDYRSECPLGASPRPEGRGEEVAVPHPRHPQPHRPNPRVPFPLPLAAGEPEANDLVVYADGHPSERLLCAPPPVFGVLLGPAGTR